MGKDEGMIRIAICDDETNIRSYLASLVRKQAVECEIAEYGSADAFLAAGAAGETYDLLFLDIDLGGAGTGSATDTAPDGPDGKNFASDGFAESSRKSSYMDGIALARRLRGMNLHRQPLIVFVTGYDSYVYEAFDVEAFQYLIKPIDEVRFAELFRRAVQRIAAETKRQQAQAAAETKTQPEPTTAKTKPQPETATAKTKPQPETATAETKPQPETATAETKPQPGIATAEAEQRRRSLVIQQAGVRKVVPLDNIYYAESQGHKILLHLKDSILEFYGKIGELEQSLPEQFFRIHKGYLINLAYVEEYTHTAVTLTNGEQLLISKYKYDAFAKAHLRYLQ